MAEERGNAHRGISRNFRIGNDGRNGILQEILRSAYAV